MRRLMEEGRIHRQHVPRAGSHSKDSVERSDRNTTSPWLELRLGRGKGNPQSLQGDLAAQRPGMPLENVQGHSGWTPLAPHTCNASGCRLTSPISRGNINHPNVGSYGDRDDKTQEELEGQVATTMSATGKNWQHLITFMSVEPGSWHHTDSPGLCISIWSW